MTDVARTIAELTAWLVSEARLIGDTEALDHAMVERLCAVSSPSGDLEGLNEAARCLGEALERRGLVVEIQQEAGADDENEGLAGAGEGIVQHLLQQRNGGRAGSRYPEKQPDIGSEGEDPEAEQQRQA